nr:hypothetical protein [Tanacetum cinerariifolium]
MRATAVGGVVEAAAGCGWLRRRRKQEVVDLLELAMCKWKKGENDISNMSGSNNVIFSRKYSTENDEFFGYVSIGGRFDTKNCGGKEHSSDNKDNMSTIKDKYNAQSKIRKAEKVRQTTMQEYLLEFTSEYGIPETLHPELPGPEDRILDFPEGKVGVYTRFFEFANFRFPISQFLFDVLEWMSFSKRPGKNTPQCYTKPLDSLKNWNNRFFWVDERVFPTVMDWRTNAPKDGMPAESTYSIEDVRALDTHRTPIQKQREMLLCVVGISRRYYLGDEVYPTFLHDDDRDMDLFNLIRAPNPTKVKTGSRPRAPHEVPLLTLTATRVIEMDDPAAATDSSGVPSTIERSPSNFAHEAGGSDQGTVAPEMPLSEDVPATDAPGAGQAEEVVATDPPAATESRKRGRDGTDGNAPPKSLRRDHGDPRPTGSSHGGKSLAVMQLGLASTVFVPENAPAGVSDPEPLSFADPPSHHPADIAQDPDSENAFSSVKVGSPKSIYRPEWGVVNGSLLDTPEACQDLVDHVAHLGYFSELRHMHNDEFLRQYNVNLARQVAMGKSVAQVARQDKRIQARELKIKNLKSLLETAADMKKAAEDRSAGLIQELEDMRVRFSDLQVSNERLSQQVATLQEQVGGEEKLKAAFEEFKRYEDDRVERRCAELDARLDALSIDFDEELYPHMLTAIAGRRWVIGRRLRLAVMKCGESIEMRQAFADVVSAGIAKDQLEGLKDAPMDVIMAALYLESDTGNDASQYICDLRPSSSQLTIPVYPEVRDPRNPWAYKEEMLLADAIAANISLAEKKKKYRIICRTHGVGSAHHAQSDGVPVSVLTVVPQGLALLLADAATQTEF